MCSSSKALFFTGLNGSMGEIVGQNIGGKKKKKHGGLARFAPTMPHAASYTHTPFTNHPPTLPFQLNRPHSSPFISFFFSSIFPATVSAISSFASPSSSLNPASASAPGPQSRRGKKKKNKKGNGDTKIPHLVWGHEVTTTS